MLLLNLTKWYGKSCLFLDSDIANSQIKLPKLCYHVLSTAWFLQRLIFNYFTELLREHEYNEAWLISYICHCKIEVLYDA